MTRWPLAVLAAALARGSGGCGSISGSAGKFTPVRSGVLTVATSTVPTAGFWRGTPSRPTGGFEYELAHELAERFGLHTVRIRIVHFHRIVAGHLGGADLGLSLITPTAERERSLDFSTPYLDSPPTVLVRAGTRVPDLASARELRWGAIRSTTFVERIDQQIAPETTTRVFNGQRQVLKALKAGAVDATLFDLPLAVSLADHSRGRIEAVAQLPKPEEIAVALPRGSDNVEAVDSAIRAFTADGTIHDLLERWVGSDAANAEHALPLLRTSR
jgi:polar amino acid transport system substrate-binding protein